MAAYAALVSVMQIIHQIQTHPFPPISIDKQQLKSLTENVTFLQEFLEGYNSPFDYRDEADPLEMRIADAAYAAEDVIESYIVDNIHLAAKTTHHVNVDDFDCIIFYENVQKVIEEMDLINKEVMEMDVSDKVAVELEMRRKVINDASFRSTSTDRRNVMVGFNDELLQLLDRLINCEGQPKCQVVPIVGMGGIGKTTLAKNVFESACIKDHFDVCVWATISQDYNIRETLSEVLSHLGGCLVSESEEDLGLQLHKHLWDRRYLVIMDDMWSIDVWDKMKFFFPDCGNGSRIIVTTRLLNLATHLTDCNSVLDMKFLDEVNSWALFSNVVFGKERCPLELEQIGKKIVNKCNGLPLSIVVIGSLLAKSPLTREYWELIEENLISILNSEYDEYCLRILRMSYNHLPVYLKPCFMYMGMFEEDRAVNVSKLIKLWVSEGFLKPRNNKSLETVGEEYLKDLVDRNMILVDELGSVGNVKYCKTHDLVRDLCLKEAERQGFYCVLKDQDSRRGMDRKRRVVIDCSMSSNDELRDVLKSFSHVRSFLNVDSQVLPDSRLLRILRVHERFDPWGINCSLEYLFKYVNSRYIALRAQGSYVVNINSSINVFWNLHTLLIPSLSHVAPIEIWKMHQLRHVRANIGAFNLIDPPRGNNDIVIMENLQTLKRVANFYLDEEVVRRIPNLKNLGVRYDGKLIKGVNCLSYLEYLSKLEVFFCWTKGRDDELLQNITFPKSLKKLTLIVWDSKVFGWEDILQKIGRLPLLLKLKLTYGFFRTRKWETIEGHFPTLKILELTGCGGLQNWIVSESYHFPLLQELHLSGLRELEEIPSEIGEIPTLNSIVLARCSRSAVVSAHKIVEEQKELQGELDLHVRVNWSRSRGEAEYLESLASPNFHIRIIGCWEDQQDLHLYGD